jgi:cytoskeleton protein RodZ
MSERQIAEAAMVPEPSAEPPQNSPGAGAKEPSLGKFLVETRNRRGLSTDDLIRQTRIPAHYVRMIESDDYGLISDQLYLLPFLRRYASFLGLDGEEIAMRFIREVQKADANVARMAEPIPVQEPAATRRNWVAPAIAATTVAIVALGYLAISGRHRHVPISTEAVPSKLSGTASTAAMAAPAPPEPADASAGAPTVQEVPAN